MKCYLLRKTTSILTAIKKTKRISKDNSRRDNMLRTTKEEVKFEQSIRFFSIQKN